jgi:hypothetical protein
MGRAVPLSCLPAQYVSGGTFLSTHAIPTCLANPEAPAWLQVIPAPAAAMEGSLGAALEATPAPGWEAPPLGTRRVVFLSGMYAAEVMETISAYREAGEARGWTWMAGMPKLQHQTHRAAGLGAGAAAGGATTSTHAEEHAPIALELPSCAPLPQACQRPFLLQRSPTTTTVRYRSWCRVRGVHDCCGLGMSGKQGPHTLYGPHLCAWLRRP